MRVKRGRGGGMGGAAGAARTTCGSVLSAEAGNMAEKYGRKTENKKQEGGHTKEIGDPPEVNYYSGAIIERAIINPKLSL